jgi:hypothetical protein
MGRGRQKAKHTKVARELKYFSPDTNLDALQQELRGDSDDAPVVEIDGDEDEDPYAVDPYATDDEDDYDPAEDLEAKLAAWSDLAEA